MRRGLLGWLGAVWLVTMPAHAQDTAARVPPPDYLRAGLEATAMLAGGTIWYWLDDRNIVDWDYDSWEQRFHESAYRFDNNEFPINFIGHPLSGAAYYGLPRANRMDVYTSLLYAATTSFIWEFFLEFQERFSINDFITTPLGGLAIGESLIRLGRYLDARAHPVLAWIFGLPIALHETMDGRAVGHEGDGAPDEPTGWGELRMGYAFEWAMPSGDTDARAFDVHRVFASMRFVGLEEHRRPGAGVTFFTDAEVTALRMEGLASSTGYGFDLDADTVILGVHARDLVRRGDALFGTSAVIGTNVGHVFRFSRMEWRDRLSYTSFPGVAVDAEEHLGAFSARFSGRFNGVFGATHEPAFARWRAEHPGVETKTILERHGYWYGWGWASRLELELSFHGVTIGGAMTYVTLDSQEGYDRLQDQVGVDVDAASARLDGALFARVTLPYALFVEATWDVELRTSVFDGEPTSRRLDRVRASVGAAF